jgi:hypothetical protein
MYLFSLEIAQGKLHNYGKENMCQGWHNNINNIIDHTHMYQYKILFSRKFLNGGPPILNNLTLHTTMLAYKHDS